MNINLKRYQETAVDQLVDAVKGLLGKDGQKKVCVFQSPTGSGKTVMTAKFIENLIKELPDEDMCFIWVSVGKGDLHLQSKYSLERIFAGSPRVSLVEEEFTGSRERVVKNEVKIEFIGPNSEKVCLNKDIYESHIKLLEKEHTNV